MPEIKDRPEYIEVALAGLIALSVLLAVEIMITVVLVGSLPTDIYVYPLRHSGFYKILWASSPWETVKLLLIDKAVLVVEHKESVNGIRVWGLFFYALNLLLHCVVTLLAGVGWVSGRFRKMDKSLMLFALGSCLLIFATHYVYLSSCCGAGPAWIVDVWMLSRVYDPVASPDWWGLYQFAERLFIFAQILLATGGAVLMFRGWVLSRR